MLVVPTSKIILLKNPIEIDYMNELTFSSKQAQYNYFHNLPKLECDEATYIRKDNAIRFPTDPDMIGITYDDLIQYNYCMYQNDKWSNKWFYAFIKNVKYDNNGLCFIEIETDVWQTWCFDITLKNSFVEREHVNDDTIGKHTVPENLELGEYVCNKLSQAEFGGKEASLSTLYNCYIVVAVSVDSNGDGVVGNSYDGLYSALKYYAFPHDSTGIANLNTFIQDYSEDGRNEAIRCVFLVPEKLIGYINPTDNSITPSSLIGMHWINLHGHEDDQTGLNKMIAITTGKLQNNYQPKNNKLLTWPYRFMKVSNNSGIDVTYNYEDFVIDANNGNPTFIIYSCLSIGGSIRMVPMNYKGITYNHDEGINMGKFPTLSWVNDEFINWLTQNAVNIGVKTFGNIIQIASGALMLGGGSTSMAGAGNIMSGFEGIANTLGQVYQRSLVPTQVEGNINSGDVITASNKNDFIFYDMSIKEEYAKIIDGYFNAYGYKVNVYKTPNINGRRYWNYVKTIGCNVIGDIPQEDMQKIKQVFDTGITFWHDPTKFLDYSQSNTIVT